MAISLLDQTSPLGFGVVQPLRRVGSDFESGGGERLIRAAVEQILGTRKGSLPWRPRFGASLDQFRHANIDEGLQALIATHIGDAIRSFEPRVRIQELQIDAKDEELRVKLVWSIVSPGPEGSRAIVGPVTQEIAL